MTYPLASVRPALRGVEDHELQSCADDFAESVKRLIVKHIGVARSDSTTERTQASLAMDVLLDDMRDEAKALVDRYVAEMTALT